MTFLAAVGPPNLGGFEKRIRQARSLCLGDSVTPGDLPYRLLTKQQASDGLDWLIAVQVQWSITAASAKFRPIPFPEHGRPLGRLAQSFAVAARGFFGLLSCVSRFQETNTFEASQDTTASMWLYKPSAYWD